MSSRDAARVRLAGHDRDRLGRDVTWTIADGERGRRWREVTVDPAGVLVRSLTLETGRGGQWLRLEIAAAAGLLSLHPDRDGAVRGNIVAGDGIRHLDLGALDPPLVDIRGSLVGEAALCRALERLVPAGQGTATRVARVEDDLSVTIVELAVERRDARTWELTDGEDVRTIAVGELGRPATGPSSVEWPLETGS